MRELNPQPSRTNNMKRLITPLALILFLVVALAACGSTTEVGTAPDDPEGEDVTVEDVVETPGDDGSIPIEDDGVVEGGDPLPMIDPADEQVITNDVMVSPAVTTPSELVLNPDDDTELWVRFIGGDPNCTAASVTLLTETPDLVEVELQVGITEDAMARSCVADEFALRVELQLSESAAGKTLGFAQGESPEAPLVTPDLSTDSFLGLTEAEAAAIADENGITWRTVRVDEENAMVTMDYSPSRLNFEIDKGVITVVTLG